ncbi:MAG: hypothetical protein WD317_01065 [Balneolaceae bacterium]
MRQYILRFLLLACLLVPMETLAQITDSAESSGEGIPADFYSPYRSGTEPREVHYTDILLESDLGRQALQRFGELRERGEYNSLTLRQTTFSVGDQEPFFVRNLEEGTDQDPAFDEVLFELRRSEDNVEL